MDLYDPNHDSSSEDEDLINPVINKVPKPTTIATTNTPTTTTTTPTTTSKSSKSLLKKWKAKAKAKAKSKLKLKSKSKSKEIEGEGEVEGEDVVLEAYWTNYDGIIYVCKDDNGKAVLYVEDKEKSMIGTKKIQSNSKSKSNSKSNTNKQNNRKSYEWTSLLPGLCVSLLIIVTLTIIAFVANENAINYVQEQMKIQEDILLESAFVYMNSYDSSIQQTFNSSVVCSSLQMCNMQTDTTVIGSGYHEGLVMDYTTPGIKYPPSTNITEIEFRKRECSARTLTRGWLSASASNEGFSYAYYGDVDYNFMFQYPATRWTITEPDIDGCSIYDVRYRPWFTAATGPRNLAILLDITSSMSTRRLERVKAVISRTLGGLTVSDHVAVYTFTGTQVYQLLADLPGSDYPSGLMPVTNILLQELQTALEAITASNSDNVNFLSAFNTAFSAFSDVSQTPACGNNQILFISDSEDTTVTSAQILTQQSLVIPVDGIDQTVIIFPFLIGNDASSGLANDLACRSGGVYSFIPEDASDDFMRERFMIPTIYGAYGTIHDTDNRQVRWVEYADILTGTRIASCSVTVFANRDSDNPVFLGVVGSDIALDAIFINAPIFGIGAVRNRINNSSERCIEVGKPPANINKLRPSENVC